MPNDTIQNVVLNEQLNKDNEEQLRETHNKQMLIFQLKIAQLKKYENQLKKQQQLDLEQQLALEQQELKKTKKLNFKNSLII